MVSSQSVSPSQSSANKDDVAIVGHVGVGVDGAAMRCQASRTWTLKNLQMEQGAVAVVRHRRLIRSCRGGSNLNALR